MAALITTPRLMAIGGGALAELPGLLARLGLSRPLIVTDPYIAKCGILDRATALLDGAGVAVVGALPTPFPIRRPTRSRPASDASRPAISTASSLSAGAARSTPPRACRCSTPMAGGCATTRCRTRSRASGRRSSRYPPRQAPARRCFTGFTVVSDTETEQKMLIAGLACCPTAAIVDFELTHDDAAAPHGRHRDRQPDPCDRSPCQPPREPTFTDGLATARDGPSIARNIRTACADPQKPRRARGDDARRDQCGDGVFQRERRAWSHGMKPADPAPSSHVPHGLSNAMLALPETRLVSALGGARTLCRLRPCDGGSRGGRGQPVGGRAAARRASPAQRRSQRAEPARLRHRPRPLATSPVPVMASQALPRARPPTTRACRRATRSSSYTSAFTSRENFTTRR